MIRTAKHFFAILSFLVLINGCAAMEKKGPWLNYDDGLQKGHEGYVEEAVEDYERALSRNPKIPSVRVSYGLLLIDMGRVSEGIQLIQEEANLFPESRTYVKSILQKYAGNS